jgi:hypothetical protein
LHQSQVKAYREAGLKALKDWAQSLSLEPMEDSDTKESFSKRCVLASRSHEVPNWSGILESSKIVSLEIQRRALETYEKYHPVGEQVEEDRGAEPSEGEEGEAEPSEGEAETEEEIETTEQKAAETASATKPKNKAHAKTNKQKNKVAARKKGNAAKGAMRKNFGAHRRGKKNAAGKSG